MVVPPPTFSPKIVTSSRFAIPSQLCAKKLNSFYETHENIEEVEENESFYENEEFDDDKHRDLSDGEGHRSRSKKKSGEGDAS